MAQNQIHGGRQIKPSSVDKTRVDSSIITNDGAHPFAANQSIGNNLLTDLANPTNAQDAATKSYVDSNVQAGDGLFFTGKNLHIGGSASIQINPNDIQISPTYAGQSSLTTLGAVSSGTWQGSIIQVSYGGTGQNFSSASGILKFTSGTASTVTAPSSALVGIADTQILSNKTLNNTTTLTLKDDLFTLQNSADNAKQIKFQLAGLSTGSTRTFSFPDNDGTLALLDSPDFVGIPTAPTPLVGRQ